MPRRKSPFSENTIREALLAHADSLVRGQDNSTKLLARYQQARHALEGLFGLAEQVSDVLPPVDPADTFVAELKAKLAEMRSEQIARAKQRRERRKKALQIAGVAGLTLSGLAMVALGVRFIIGLLSRRRATAT
jgi:hypothetical protein